MPLLSSLSDHWVFFVCFSGLIGLLIGSFLNVVVLRLPPRLEWQWRREAQEFLGDRTDDPAPPPPGLVVTSSHCPHCQHRLAWWENLPLVSFALLRGRCRRCKAPISWQYPLVEALTAGLFAACAATFGPTAFVLFAFAFVSLLLAASAIDARTTWLPDGLVYPLLWLGLIAAALAPELGRPTILGSAEAIAGAVGGYLFLWSVYWVFKAVTGKEGMGYGDFKLLAALGAWCGPAALVPIVLIATLSGLVVGGGLMWVRGQDRATAFAFGPYLAIGGAVEFFMPGSLLAGLSGWLLG